MLNRKKEFASFAEFYKFYNSEHQVKASRVCHVVGILLSLCFLFCALLTSDALLLLSSILLFYAPSALSHVIFAKNSPSSAWQYPWYSFLGDLKLFWDIFRGETEL